MQEGKERWADPSARKETVAAGGEKPRRGGETQGRVKELQTRRGWGTAGSNLEGRRKDAWLGELSGARTCSRPSCGAPSRKDSLSLRTPRSPDLSRHHCDPGAGGPRPLLSHGVLNARCGSRAGIRQELRATGWRAGARVCRWDSRWLFLLLEFCSQVGHL